MAGADGSGDVEPLLISDAERNAAVERLNGAFADGRLTHEEYTDRLDQIYQARTDVELAACFRGLPGVLTRPPKAKLTLRRRSEHLVEASSPALICTAIWAMTSAPGYFWPMWVWLPTGITVIGGYLGTSGRRRRRSEREEWLSSQGYRDHKEQRRRHREAWQAWGDQVRDHTMSGMPGTVGMPPMPGMPGTPGMPGSGAAGTTDSDTRAILSVVFVDIVGSTESAVSLGDRRWRELLDEFSKVVDSVLDAHHGSKVFTKGDEVVATFTSPAQAIAYAREVRADVASLQLKVRAGIHTGEIEGRGGDLSGITLHIGQRVSSVAEADEILVSSTVRDIAYGSGIEFVDHGEHELRGLHGLWHLYSVGSA
jgi:class 3 adenylate cyclase